jgi:phosphopantothenoylcysteine decarboxylase/phosphopantothenate--cysteine ligase
MSKGKILFQLSGSIACYKACAVLSRLVQAGYEVEVVATASALRFVGEATLEGLVGKQIHTDLYAKGQAMEHIHLMKWADLAIVCPATANTINRLASGTGDDLLSTLFLAHDFKKPFLIAPAMNSNMYRHPTTRLSMERLSSWGITVLKTDSGSLACGDVGEGRLLEPEVLFQEVESRLTPIAQTSHTAAQRMDQQASPRSLKVLVTSGGTREPIDGVRSITNFSSGKTGAIISEYLSSVGHDVTLLHADNAIRPAALSVPMRTLTFSTFSDLATALQRELSKQFYDAVIHMAAVSDYSIERIEAAGRVIEPAAGKIESEAAVTLQLKRNPKLVDSLRTLSLNNRLKVIAFKLTNGLTNGHNSTARLEAIRKLASRGTVDLIVHNDLSEIDAARDLHLSTILDVQDVDHPKEIVRPRSKADLAAELNQALLQLCERNVLS